MLEKNHCACDCVTDSRIEKSEKLFPLGVLLEYKGIDSDFPDLPIFTASWCQFGILYKAAKAFATLVKNGCTAHSGDREDGSGMQHSEGLQGASLVTREHLGTSRNRGLFALRPLGLLVPCAITETGKSHYR